MLLRYGAADEARTRYLHLGKVALYQMSYGRTFHVLVPGCLPATLIIIPYRPAIVNHKFAFSAKKVGNPPVCIQKASLLRALPVSSFKFVITYTKKIDLLSLL